MKQSKRKSIGQESKEVGPLKHDDFRCSIFIFNLFRKMRKKLKSPRQILPLEDVFPVRLFHGNNNDLSST